MPLQFHVGVQETVKDSKEFRDRLRERMSTALHEIGRKQVGEMKTASPRFSGKLANSHTAAVDEDNLQLVITNKDAQKALYLHEGTKHNKMPPPDALKKWAKRVLGDERLAFVVARSILRKGGLKARKWMDRVFRQNEGYVRSRIKAEQDRVAEEFSR